MPYFVRLCFRAMGSFLATFRNFALIRPGRSGFVAGCVALVRHAGHWRAGKKLPKWGCFCLIREFFGIPAGENGCGVNWAGGWRKLVTGLVCSSGVVIMPAVVGAVSGKVKGKGGRERI